MAIDTPAEPRRVATPVPSTSQEPDRSAEHVAGPLPHAGPAAAGTQACGRSGHFGIGPKGYTRSDQRILENICDRLMAHEEIDASDVVVRVENGAVTLDGTVDARLTKQLIEEVTDTVLGVQRVDNRLRVILPSRAHPDIVPADVSAHSRNGS